MDSRRQALLKLGAALALAALGVGFVTVRWSHFERGGEEGAQLWFYQENAKRLYAAPRETVPPDSKHSGGVRAIVVAFRGEEKDASKRRIAYLETYGPELKQLLERLQAARFEGRALKEHVPSRDGEFFQTNDLVKRVEDTRWYARRTPEGQKIMTEWKSWRGPAGQAPVVCLP